MVGHGSGWIGFGRSTQVAAVTQIGSRNLYRLATAELTCGTATRSRLRGKQPKLSASRQEHLVKFDDDEEKNVVELAELFGVGRSTVYLTLAWALVEAGKGDRDNCARWELPGEGMVREAVENLGP
jgi:hypothetical protein